METDSQELKWQPLYPELTSIRHKDNLRRSFKLGFCFERKKRTFWELFTVMVEPRRMMYEFLIGCVKLIYYNLCHTDVTSTPVNTQKTMTQVLCGGRVRDI